MVYEFDPNMAPDADFLPGELRWLVPGNEGRLLDPRRTPVRVVGVALETGHVVLEIAAFEDRGARWALALESVDGLQFAKASAAASDADVAAFTGAVARLDRPLAIAADPERARETREALAAREAEAAAWLRERSAFVRSGARIEARGRDGIPALGADLEAFLRERDLSEMEDAFATQYVRNPDSGELVKGHRIVLAELGLVAYEGKVVRDPDLFAGAWRKERRAEPILSRLAFVRAHFGAAGTTHLDLYRGMSSHGRLEPPRNESLISATFASEVAMSHFEGRDPSLAGVLLRQPVPVERVLMTYVETAQMNRMYREAEAILLFEPGNPLF